MLLLVAPALAAPATQPTTSRFTGVHIKNDDEGAYEVGLTVRGRRHVRTLEGFEETTLPEDWDTVEVKIVDQPPLTARRGEFVVIKNGQLYRHAPQGP